jgi:hypothetical protein
MANRDFTTPDDDLHLIEASTLAALPDPSLNAIRVEVADPGGGGVAFLIPPRDAVNLCKLVMAALGRLIPGDFASTA